MFVSLRTRAFLAAFSGLLVAVSAHATEQTLICFGGPDFGSSFTIDFGPYGADTSAISETSFDLIVDESTGQARIAYYYQLIDSLTLPGGLTTGDIIVSIVPGSSSGTFSPGANTFTTAETYEIYFENDLSAFGLSSPATLPGASSGELTPSGDGTGRADLIWSGVGYLPDPGNPGGFIEFTYQCRAGGDYQTQASCNSSGCESGDVDADCDVDLDDLTAMLTNFGRQRPGVSSRDGDLDESGGVDLADLANLLSAYGANCN